MNGEDGNKNNEQGPEVHPAPDVSEFANTYVAFSKALNKSMLDSGLAMLDAEHQIELFRIWYIDKTDREILKSGINLYEDGDDEDDDKPDWYANGQD